MTFQSALNTHSTRLPSGSSTTLSKYPSPDVRGSPLMVYPALRSFSVSSRTSSLLSSAVGQTEPVFPDGSILYIGTAHQLQVGSAVEADKVGFKSFLRVDVFLIACTFEVTDIEFFHFFQTESPDGDVMYSHKSICFCFMRCVFIYGFHCRCKMGKGFPEGSVSSLPMSWKPMCR